MEKCRNCGKEIPDNSPLINHCSINCLEKFLPSSSIGFFAMISTPQIWYNKNKVVI